MLTDLVESYKKDLQESTQKNLKKSRKYFQKRKRPKSGSTKFRFKKKQKNESPPGRRKHWTNKQNEQNEQILENINEMEAEMNKKNQEKKSSPHKKAVAQKLIQIKILQGK